MNSKKKKVISFKPTTKKGGKKSSKNTVYSSKFQEGWIRGGINE